MSKREDEGYDVGVACMAAIIEAGICRSERHWPSLNDGEADSLAERLAVVAVKRARAIVAETIKTEPGEPKS